jgi:catechol 2,3-dioxygenase-like lactoylglutathione lyase family enzyme
MITDEVKPRIRLERLDHLVLTVTNIDRTCEFYEHVLGMKRVVFGDNRRPLAFGSQKIKLHQVGHEFEPTAAAPTPGTADLCFLARTPIKEVFEHLYALEVEEEGPLAGALELAGRSSLYTCETLTRTSSRSPTTPTGSRAEHRIEETAASYCRGSGATEGRQRYE